MRFIKYVPKWYSRSANTSEYFFFQIYFKSKIGKKNFVFIRSIARVIKEFHLSFPILYYCYTLAKPAIFFTFYILRYMLCAYDSDRFVVIIFLMPFKVLLNNNNELSVFIPNWDNFFLFIYLSEFYVKFPIILFLLYF